MRRGEALALLALSSGGAASSLWCNQSCFCCCCRCEPVFRILTGSVLLMKFKLVKVNTKRHQNKARATENQRVLRRRNLSLPDDRRPTAKSEVRFGCCCCCAISSEGARKLSRFSGHLPYLITHTRSRGQSQSQQQRAGFFLPLSLTHRV